jgi:hypothetical protein
MKATHVIYSVNGFIHEMSTFVYETMNEQIENDIQDKFAFFAAKYKLDIQPNVDYIDKNGRELFTISNTNVISY